MGCPGPPSSAIILSGPALRHGSPDPASMLALNSGAGSTILLSQSQHGGLRWPAYTSAPTGPERAAAVESILEAFVQDLWASTQAVQEFLEAETPAASWRPQRRPTTLRTPRKLSEPWRANWQGSAWNWMRTARAEDLDSPEVRGPSWIVQ